VSDAFRKLAKKDKEQLKRIQRKIEQILENPYQFKPLRKPLQELRRVHIGSFVLVYKAEGSRVKIMRYKHHDEVYQS
jgi:YafQ family addiction module toxin component